MTLNRARLKRIAWWIIGIVAGYAVVGFLVLPPIVKSVLSKQLAELLHRPVTIEAIQINPFLLTVKVAGFSVKDRSGDATFLGFEELFLDAQLASLVKGGPVLREVRLKAPLVNIVRNQDESYNFSDLLESTGTKPDAKPDASKEAKPFVFSINNIQLEAGRIEFEDVPKTAHHTVRDIRIAIPFVSNLPYEVEMFVQPAFEAVVNDTPLRLAGRTKPFKDTLETTLDINARDIVIPKYLAYVPVELPVRIPSATLGLQTELSFIRTGGKPSSLELRGQIELKDLAVTDKADIPILTLPLFTVGIHSAEMLSRKIHLSSVVVQSPQLHVRRDRTGTVNLTTLTPKPSGAPPARVEVKAQKPKTDEPPLSLEVDEVKLTGAKVRFVDEATSPTFRTTIETLDLNVAHFSTDPGKAATVNLGIKTDGGESVTHDGSFTLDPLAVDGRVEVQEVRINRYAPYYRPHLLFNVADGVIGLSTQYRFRKAGGQDHITLSGTTIGLKSLRLRKPDEKLDFVSVPAFSVNRGEVDLAAQTVSIGEIATQKGVVLLTRGSDGKLNVENLVAPGKDPAKPPAEPRAATGTVPARPWVVSLKRVAIERYAIRVEDRATPDPVHLSVEPLTLTVEDFSTAKNSKAKVALNVTLNKTGTIGITGAVGLDPLTAKVKASLKELDLVPFQPYVSDKLNVLLTGGALTTNGDVEVTQNAQQKTSVSFAGDTAVTKFTLLDKGNSEELLKWESLAVTGIRVHTEPMKVDVRQVALTDFYSRLIVHADGTLNVQGLVKSQPTAKQGEKEGTPQAPTEPTPTSIETVTLQGGSIVFTDRFVKPNFTANMKNVGGRITGLSSEESRRAEVELRGNLANQSPLEISGTVNPLSRDLFADIKTDFKDIELSPMTPYAAKYAGYSIQKGKLSLSLKYHIEHRKLAADHHLYLDQFTFGEKVESPEATNLPVRLAVSLLKDRNGVIDLNFPVSGSLDDPEFSVWGVVLKVLKNLLVKAATSPFSLIQALAGDNVELSQLEFDYGSAQLNGSATEKLSALAKILADRPALNVEITGHVDVEKDREGLRRSVFDRKVKAQKLNDLVKRGEGGQSIDTITVKPDEYEEYLTKAYKQESFPKPKNFLGLTKSLPVPEMEKLMLTHLQITDDDLHQLAGQRAQTSKDYLVTTGNVDRQRLFLVEAKTLAPERKEKFRDSRVEFSLQ